MSQVDLDWCNVQVDPSKNFQHLTEKKARILLKFKQL